MDNSVDRKNAIRLYLTGTIGQITVIAVIVYLLRRMGIVVDYTTVIGMIAIVKETIGVGVNEKAVLRFYKTALSFTSISIFPW